MPADKDGKQLSKGPRRLLRCDTCARSEENSAEELLRYTREGWPKCCGQVMAVFTEAVPSAADDTALDKPALPPSS